MDNAYELLGLTKSATEEDIKAAYRRLAKVLHPDLNPGDTIRATKFQMVTDAYLFLLESMKKKKISPDSPPFNFTTDELLRKIFKSSPSSFHKKTQDLSYILKVSFLEACYGVRKKITLTGVQGQNALEVDIPAGIQDDQTLRFYHPSGQGDVVLIVKVADHPLFVRDGSNIVLSYPLTVPEYIRGGVFNIQTVWGKFAINVPPLAPLQVPLRLEGKGVPDKSGLKGDQLVYLEVIYPPPGKALEELLQMWEKVFPDKPRNTIADIL